MVTEKLKSIINSCKLHEQLDTCKQWIDCLIHNTNDYVECLDLIKKRRNELKNENNMMDVHQMD